MFNRPGPYLLSMLVVSVGLACGSTGQSYDEQGQPAASPQTFVAVDNHNWSDIRVYVVRDGTASRIRLGMVTSMTDERFEIPRGMLSGSGSVRLLADPIGSRGVYLTEPIQVSPGQEIEWRLENNLNLSSVSVW